MLQVRYCKNCGQDFVTDIDDADYCDSCLLENEEDYEEIDVWANFVVTKHGKLKVPTKIVDSDNKEDYIDSHIDFVEWDFWREDEMIQEWGEE